MPKPNYAFAKRQRELAKKQKKEAKRLQKSPPSTQNPEVVPPTPPESGQT
jgi:hypothetical protein